MPKSLGGILKAAAKQVETWNADADPQIIAARRDGDAAKMVIHTNCPIIGKNAAEADSIFKAAEAEVAAVQREVDASPIEGGVKDGGDQKAASDRKAGGDQKAVADSLAAVKERVAQLKIFRDLAEKYKTDVATYPGAADVLRGNISGAPKDSNSLGDAQKRAADALAKMNQLKVKSSSLVNQLTTLLHNMRNIHADITVKVADIRIPLLTRNSKAAGAGGAAGDMKDGADRAAQIQSLDVQIQKLRELQSRLAAEQAALAAAPIPRSVSAVAASAPVQDAAKGLSTDDAPAAVPSVPAPAAAPVVFAPAAVAAASASAAPAAGAAAPGGPAIVVASAPAPR